MKMPEKFQPQKAGILYLSYDGLLEPLGRSQILPYLVNLAKDGFDFSVISFEKKHTIEEEKKLRLLLKVNKITWFSLKYHKYPLFLSTIFDIVYGVIYAGFIIRRRRIKIIHSRSYVAFLIGLLLNKFLKVKAIFDTRGFWVDERVEAGIWKKNGLMFKLGKVSEGSFYKNSDMIVTLTESAKGKIAERIKNVPIIKIPTCVNLAKFDAGEKVSGGLNINLKDRLVFMYSGSVSTWLPLEKMLDFFKACKDTFPNPYLLILSKEIDYLTGALKRFKITDEDVSCLAAEHDLMPQYISLANAGLAFYKPGFSRIACCPTKVGEYLACRKPVIITAGVGDMDNIIESNDVGVVLSGFNNNEYRKASGKLFELLNDAELPDRCRYVAENEFSLEKGVLAYSGIYNNLLMCQ